MAMTELELKRIFSGHIDDWCRDQEGEKTFEDYVLSAMREAVRVEVESNSKALCNVICEATDTLALTNQSLTVGEIRDMINIYKNREAEKVSVGFTKWKDDNCLDCGAGDEWTIGPIGRVYTTEQLYQEYIKSLNK